MPTPANTSVHACDWNIHGADTNGMINLDVTSVVLLARNLLEALAVNLERREVVVALDRHASMLSSARLETRISTGLLPSFIVKRTALMLRSAMAVGQKVRAAWGTCGLMRQLPHRHIAEQVPHAQN